MGALVQSGRVTGDEARQIAVSAVEIALNSDTGDQTDGALSDSVLDFAVQQAVPRMGSTREAFDMTASSAAVCRGVIADLLLMGGPRSVLRLPGGSRDIGNGFRINQCHYRVDGPHMQQCYPV